MIFSFVMLEAAAALVLLFILAVIVYRLTLHPLARYPGPWLGKITDWYTEYHAWKGDRHLDLYELHQKHGKIVRYGPNRLSINSNSAMQDIYGPKANVEKSSVYSVFARFFGLNNSHSLINKDHHSRKKNILAQSLSDSAIKSMEGLIIENVQTFCECLSKPEESQALVGEKPDSKGWSPSRDMGDWFSYLSVDVVGQLCFGTRFQCLTKPDNRYIRPILRDGSQALVTIGHMPSIQKFPFHRLLFWKLIRNFKIYKAFGERQGIERLKSKSENKDVFSYLIEARDPETGEGFSEPEIIGESSLLILAGSDTTATTFVSTTFYLLHNLDALEKAKAEVRSAFDNIEEIHLGSKLASCRYLRACIDEALRMSPPVGSPLPRAVLPGGITIDGEHFPAGVDIGTPTYALHHSEEYYSDPFAYKPSRWLSGTEGGPTEDEVALARSAFSAFSHGPRGCVGKGMAYAELTISLARVIWMFDMRLTPGSTLGEGHPSGPVGRQRPSEYQLFDKFVSETKGPLVDFRLRFLRV